jgi:hypothetical protein
MQKNSRIATPRLLCSLLEENQLGRVCCSGAKRLPLLVSAQPGPSSPAFAVPSRRHATRKRSSPQCRLSCSVLPAMINWCAVQEAPHIETKGRAPSVASCQWLRPGSQAEPGVTITILIGSTADNSILRDGPLEPRYRTPLRVSFGAGKQVGRRWAGCE